MRSQEALLVIDIQAMTETFVSQIDTGVAVVMKKRKIYAEGTTNSTIFCRKLPTVEEFRI